MRLCPKCTHVFRAPRIPRHVWRSSRGSRNKVCRACSTCRQRLNGCLLAGNLLALMLEGNKIRSVCGCAGQLLHLPSKHDSHLPMMRPNTQRNMEKKVASVGSRGTARRVHASNSAKHTVGRARTQIPHTIPKRAASAECTRTKCTHI